MGGEPPWQKLYVHNPGGEQAIDLSIGEHRKGILYISVMQDGKIFSGAYAGSTVQTLAPEETDALEAAARTQHHIQTLAQQRADTLTL